MPINAYMVFNGNCEEAVTHYAEVFETEKSNIARFGDMPSESGMEMPDEMKRLVMHTNLQIHGSTVMFSDSMPGSPVTFGTNITLAVVTDNLEKLRAEFTELSQGGTVKMDLQETFWSPAYGIVEDQFGVQWQFSYEPSGDSRQ